MTKPVRKKGRAIVLTSHPGGHGRTPLPIKWGASDPMERGPVVATVTDPARRNVIGTHAGAYSVYRALAVAAGALDPLRKPDLHNTEPTDAIGPHPSWFDANKIVSIDPFGALVATAFRKYLDEGYDIRPTIAVTKARLDLPELHAALAAKRLGPLPFVRDQEALNAALEKMYQHIGEYALLLALGEGEIATSLEREQPRR